MIEAKALMEKEKGGNEAPCQTCGRWCDESFVEQKLSPYKEEIDNIQTMILWRHPIPMVMFIVAFDSTLAFIRVAKLSFLSVLMLALMIKVGVSTLLEYAGDPICGILFPDLDDLDEERSNRVRDIHTLSVYVAKLGHGFFTVFSYVDPRGQTNLVRKSLIPFGIYFFLFIIFTFTGTFWLFAIVSHMFMILPGVIMHPKIYPHMKKLVLMCCPQKEAKAKGDKPKESAPSEKDLKEEKPKTD